MTVQIQKYKMLIGGEWKDSSNGAVSSILDPSNNEVVAEVPRATKQDAKAAVESARSALESTGWVDIDPSKRGRLLTKLTGLVRESSEQLARLETLSEGKTLRESKGDVAWAARAFEYWAGLADKVEGETIPVPPKRLNYTLREPLGVTVHIVPWNYPIALAARSLAPAIAAGNGHDLDDRWVGWALAATLWRHYGSEVDSTLAKDAKLAKLSSWMPRATFWRRHRWKHRRCSLRDWLPCR